MKFFGLLQVNFTAAIKSTESQGKTDTNSWNSVWKSKVLVVG